jgi:hypothetical protein
MSISIIILVLFNGYSGYFVLPAMGLKMHVTIVFMIIDTYQTITAGIFTSSVCGRSLYVHGSIPLWVFMGRISVKKDT